MSSQTHCCMPLDSCSLKFGLRFWIAFAAQFLRLASNLFGCVALCVVYRISITYLKYLNALNVFEKISHYIQLKRSGSTALVSKIKICGNFMRVWDFNFAWCERISRGNVRVVFKCFRLRHRRSNACCPFSEIRLRNSAAKSIEIPAKTYF